MLIDCEDVVSHQVECDTILNRAGLDYPDVNYGDVTICKSHKLRFGKLFEAEVSRNPKCGHGNKVGMKSKQLRNIDFTFSQDLLRKCKIHIP